MAEIVLKRISPVIDEVIRIECARRGVSMQKFMEHVVVLYITEHGKDEMRMSLEDVDALLEENEVWKNGRVDKRTVAYKQGGKR